MRYGACIESRALGLARVFASRASLEVLMEPVGPSFAAAAPPIASGAFAPSRRSTSAFTRFFSAAVPRFLDDIWEAERLAAGSLGAAS